MGITNGKSSSCLKRSFFEILADSAISFFLTSCFGGAFVFVVSETLDLVRMIFTVSASSPKFDFRSFI